MILSLSPGALLPVPNLHGCAPSSISLGTVRKFLFSLPRVLVSQRPVCWVALFAWRSRDPGAIFSPPPREIIIRYDAP